MPSHFPDGLPAVLPATVAQIHRSLPARGEISVRVGSRVEPDDQIGQALLSPAAIFIDGAAALGVDPRDVPRRVRRKIGERVTPQQPIAKRGRRTLTSPSAGVISAIDDGTGFVVIAPDPVPVQMTASVRGYVASVEPGWSALIETPAAVIQGAFGLGGEQFGVLRLLVTDRHEPITPELIDARSAYAIIIGGAGITAAALRKAQQEQVRGVIVGSIDHAEVKAFLGDAMPSDWYSYGHSATIGTITPTVMATEGFGAQSMAEPLFDLLTRFDRQEAFLDGATTIWPAARRPRVVVPLPRLQADQLATMPQELQIGAIVRCVDERHLGVIGRVTALTPLGRLPWGARTATATVQIGETEQIVLPQTALERIG